MAVDPKYVPVYFPVNFKEPSETEKKIDLTLQNYMEEEMKLESQAEMDRRDLVLIEVRKIFLKWVRFIAIEIKKLPEPEDEEEDFGGELFVSGSHRLGVRDIGADIDTVCVAPAFCTKEHFFTYLKNSFQSHPDVTELNAVEGAIVPIISFDFQGVSIDLLFARLSENSVPRDIDILDDSILIGLDGASEKSLNGPRVTNMIFKLVGEKTFPNFLIVLRCVRRWAKKRGLYGNKLGYLGGVNCNILVAFVCQLYPNAGPSSLLSKFFKCFSEWKWPEPVMLNSIQQNPPDLQSTDRREVWSQASNPMQLMPIITPAYPAMNSAYNVSIHTLEVMKQEFKRGYEIMKQILEDKGKDWSRIFDVSDFFLKYSHYLICHIIGTGNDAESRSWIGYVESRLRRFIPALERLPLKRPIQLYPVTSKTQKSENSICYFIGFDLDLELISKMMDKNIHIDDCAGRFQDMLKEQYNDIRKEGLDFFVEHHTWKKLPKEVFEIYGGKEAAKLKRSILLPSSISNKITQDNVNKKTINMIENDMKSPNNDNKNDNNYDNNNYDNNNINNNIDNNSKKRKASDVSESDNKGYNLSNNINEDMEEESEIITKRVNTSSTASSSSQAASIQMKHIIPHLKQVNNHNEWKNKRVFVVPIVTWSLIDYK
eukprot:gene8921-12031_t